MSAYTDTLDCAPKVLQLVLGCLLMMSFMFTEVPVCLGLNAPSGRKLGSCWPRVTEPGSMSVYLWTLSRM